MRYGLGTIREGIESKMEEFDQQRKKKAKEQYTFKKKCPFLK